MKHDRDRGLSFQSANFLCQAGYGPIMRSILSQSTHRPIQFKFVSAYSSLFIARLASDDAREL